MYGNKGDDAVYGNGGDDTLYGGTSPEFDIVDADTFVFDNWTVPDWYSSDYEPPATGNDKIADFEVGHDTIRIGQNVNGSDIQSFSDLTISEDADGNAVIELGDENGVTVEGVAPGDLTDADFSFF